MNTVDVLRLLHPAIAVAVVFPLIGIVTFFSWQTRQRRLKAAAKEKTNIAPTVGLDHVNVGRWLAAMVIGVSLLGLAYPIFKTLLAKEIWANDPFQFIFVGLMFVATIVSVVLLYRAKAPRWRGIFAGFSTMGLIVLGCQDGVFRRGYEWFASHYYYGMIVAILMVISVAVLPEIYRSKAWRRAHIFLNCVALLLFLGQGITGTRDLLEIPLVWQEPAVYQCDFANKVCPQAEQGQLLPEIQSPAHAGDARSHHRPG